MLQNIDEKMGSVIIKVAGCLLTALLKFSKNFWITFPANICLFKASNRDTKDVKYHQNQ